jgi:hypothetical protein
MPLMMVVVLAVLLLAVLLLAVLLLAVLLLAVLLLAVLLLAVLLLAVLLVTTQNPREEAGTQSGLWAPWPTIGTRTRKRTAKENRWKDSLLTCTHRARNHCCRTVSRTSGVGRV